MQVESKAVFELGGGFILQGDLNGGLITSLIPKKDFIHGPDRFYLGGPSLRGFKTSAFGRAEEGKEITKGDVTTGGSDFLSAAAILRYPLKYGLLGNMNAHAHAFVNAGSLLKHGAPAPETKWKSLAQDMKTTAGVGLVVPMGGMGRVEINYSSPLWDDSTSMTQKFQLGMMMDWI